MTDNSIVTIKILKYVKIKKLTNRVYLRNKSRLYIFKYYNKWGGYEKALPSSRCSWNEKKNIIETLESYTTAYRFDTNGNGT